MRAAALGLWAFTNLELAYALLRVEERARAFATASLINVALTVVLTIWLVVGRDEGALGLLLGNYVASAVVLIGLWWAERDALRAAGRDRRAQLKPMLRFGLPTVPAEVSVFALFFVDRLWLYRFESADDAGLYSLAVKLAGIVVFTVRAFQYAWPPLAYSIETTRRPPASTRGSRPTTCCSPGSWSPGWSCSAAGSCGSSPRRSSSPPTTRCPWVALGWALYGLFLVLVAMAGRAQVTVRNAPAALCGLIVNVALLALLVPPLGITGAGLALVRRLRGDARGHVGADPQPVPGRVRMGPAGPLRARRRRADRRGRAAAADERRRRLRSPARSRSRSSRPPSWPPASSAPASSAPRGGLFSRARPARQTPVELLRGLAQALAAAREERRADVLESSAWGRARAGRARPRARIP